MVSRFRERGVFFYELVLGIGSLLLDTKSSEGIFYDPHNF